MQTLDGSQIRVREDREDTDTQAGRPLSLRGRPGGSNQGVKVGGCFAFVMPMSLRHACGLVVAYVLQTQDSGIIS